MTPDLQVHKDLKVTKDQKVTPDLQVHKDLKVTKDQKVTPDLQVHKVLKVTKKAKGQKGTPDHKDQEVPKGNQGHKGDPGSGGLSTSGFTMQGNINMDNHKITNLPDPTLATDPVTKQYAGCLYLTGGGFTMQDNIGMNGHEVLGLNPIPSDGTSAVLKSYTDRVYIKKNADIDMNGQSITGLLIIPLTSGEPITKGFVERYYSEYTNILTFKGTPGNVKVLHNDNMVDLLNGKPDVDFPKLVTVTK